MILSALIRKGGLQQVATAISATDATEEGKKAETVARVAAVAVARSTSREPFDREAFEERAAIREFDGGLSREEAERLALLEFHGGTVH